MALLVIVTGATEGAWYEIDTLASTVGSCMALEGGYTTDCARAVSNWEVAHHGETLTVSTPDGAGTAPIPFGQTVTVTVTRRVQWPPISIPVSSTFTDSSSYIETSAPQATYTNP